MKFISYRSFSNQLLSSSINMTMFFCRDRFLHVLSCLLLANFVTQLCFCSAVTSQRNPSDDKISAPPVQLHTEDPNNVMIDNGLVQVTFSRPGGFVAGIKFNGINNLLGDGKVNNRGYWDVVWKNLANDENGFERIRGTNFTVITQTQDQVEVSFSRTWDLSPGKAPVNLDKRYIVRRGSSGFYAYAIMERLHGWPDVGIGQIRIVFKLQNNLFHFMAISDDKQRVMATPQDRRTGQPLTYPEAVLLTNPTDPSLKNEVDDKYQYAMENKDNWVQGWISKDKGVGFWIITPSKEFCSGGPIKQDLISHVGPTVLSMFTSTHYAGNEMDTYHRNGDPWKKVFGPIFVYINSNQPVRDYRHLWVDAKKQMVEEVKSWPYNFVNSVEFPASDKRGSVSGQLVIQDPYIANTSLGAKSAYVGLTAPGAVGSWQADTKGYQFWVQADNMGNFIIQNVRAGDYNLYAWVPGFIGDYIYEQKITITPGIAIKLGVLKFCPPRNGPTLWEIGIPDRSAAEFYVPDPDPGLVNRLYLNKPNDKFRQYGLWERYSVLNPTQDIVFNIGRSDYRIDWFFAHVTRHVGNRTYVPTTWQITFSLSCVIPTGSYTLQLALAAADTADLQVRFNNKDAHPPHFMTGLIGRDNAIARHGIHGLYKLFTVNVPGKLLLQGNNIIYLTQVRADSPFVGHMYDYIRFEGPK